jgi:hypothetical protein
VLQVPKVRLAGHVLGNGLLRGHLLLRALFLVFVLLAIRSALADIVCWALVFVRSPILPGVSKPRSRGWADGNGSGRTYWYLWSVSWISPEENS